MCLCASSCGDGSGLDFRQRQEGDVIGDTQSEALLGLILLQLLEQSKDGGRRGILAAQTVTAAGQNDIVQASLTQGSGNIQVQGLAQRAGLLGSSRSNAEHISPEEEMRRLRTGLEIINRYHPGCVVSVDTFRVHL